MEDLVPRLAGPRRRIDCAHDALLIQAIEDRGDSVGPLPAHLREVHRGMRHLDPRRGDEVPKDVGCDLELRFVEPGKRTADVIADDRFGATQLVLECRPAQHL